MVYTVPPKQTKSRELTDTKAIVSLDDRRYVLDGPIAVLGRSRECDCVLNDPNVSRRHAELRRGSTGDWQIVDLESTNGVKVTTVVSTPPGCRPETASRSGRSSSSSTSSTSASWIPNRSRSPSSSASSPFSTCSCSGSPAAPCASSGTTAPAPELFNCRLARVVARRRPTRFWSPSGAAVCPRSERYDLFGGLSIGRSSDADVRIEDRFASAIHALYSIDLLLRGGHELDQRRLPQRRPARGRGGLWTSTRSRSATRSSASSSRSPGALAARCSRSPITRSAPTPVASGTPTEDSYYVHGRVFAVADGMGGAQAGEVASRIAADSFESAARSASRASRTCARSPRPRTSASTVSPRTTRAIRG